MLLFLRLGKFFLKKGNNYYNLTMDKNIIQYYNYIYNIIYFFK